MSKPSNIFKIGQLLYSRIRNTSFCNSLDTCKILKGQLVPGICVAAMILIVIINGSLILSFITETIIFFQQYSLLDFLFGTVWNPDATVPRFGIIPLLAGTLTISVLAIIIALVLALPTAIYLSQYSSRQITMYINPILNILGSIPTVVYGFLAIILINPILQSLSQTYNLSISTESALTAAIAMSFMLVPIILSLSYTALQAVPFNLYLASYSLGSSKEEAIIYVILPYIRSHILSATLLSLSRALGETMIVVMCAGVMANLTFNPLQPVTTVTVQIVTLFTGDANFDNISTLAGFALGAVLFLLTFIFNGLALHFIKGK